MREALAQNFALAADSAAQQLTDAQWQAYAAALIISCDFLRSNRMFPRPHFLLLIQPVFGVLE